MYKLNLDEDTLDLFEDKHQLPDLNCNNSLADAIDGLEHTRMHLERSLEKFCCTIPSEDGLVHDMFLSEINEMTNKFTMLVNEIGKTIKYYEACVFENESADREARVFGTYSDQVRGEYYATR